MDIQHCKKIFEHYGGMMRTKELEQEKIYYKNIQQLIETGYVEKVRYGYYQWVNPDDFSEIGTVSRLFPDAILCMDTALRYYGYSDRTPGGMASCCQQGFRKITVPDRLPLCEALLHGTCGSGTGADKRKYGRT